MPPGKPVNTRPHPGLLDGDGGRDDDDGGDGDDVTPTCRSTVSRQCESYSIKRTPNDDGCGDDVTHLRGRPMPAASVFSSVHTRVVGRAC